MKKLIKDLIPYLFFFLIATIIIYPYLRKGFIIAAGESQIYLNPNYINYLSMWEEKLNLGSLNYAQSRISLYGIFLNLLDLLPLGIHSSIIFIFLSFFLPAAIFFFCAKRILNNKNQLFIIAGSLLYSFNVFRTIGPLNEGQIILFIFLPLFFYYYYQLVSTKNWKYVFYIIIASFFSSTLGVNLPLFIIPYLTIFLYFIFYTISKKFKIGRVFLLQNFILVIFVVLVNFFWLFPLLFYLVHLYSVTNSGASLFSTIVAGRIVDHFRFLGLWAWRERYYYSYYYPQAPIYDMYYLSLSTYFVSILSLSFFIKKNKNYFEFFLVFLISISFLLVSGAKGPIGGYYKFLYDNLPFFKIFRDPYVKFTPVFIFAMSFALIRSLSYLSTFRRKFIFIFSSILLILILVNAYPLFTTQTMPIRVWNRGQGSVLIKVPDYWLSAKKYVENKLDLENERLTTYPFNFRSANYNWEYGAYLTGNAADYLFNVNNVKAWEISDEYSVKVSNTLLNINNKDVNIGKSIGFLNSRYLLQENDVEWRYSGGAILAPSITNNLLEQQGLKKISAFGTQTRNDLNKILNLEPKVDIHNDLYKELADKPALILYQTDGKYFLPHFYIPKNIIITDKRVEDLPKILSNKNYQPLSAIFFKFQNKNKIDIDQNKKISELPILSFQKISATKYHLLIKSAKESFPLIFVESFHPAWEIKGGLVSENQHLVANGFANSWLINPKEICLKHSKLANCSQDKNHNYNLELTIEFSAQKYFNLALVISASVFIFSVSYLIYVYLIDLKKKKYV